MGIFNNIYPEAACFKNLASIPFSFLIAAILYLFNPVKINAQNILYGDSASMANGMVKSWIELDANNDPVRLGLNMSKSVLSNIGNSYSEVSLNFPKAASDSLFDHILINWNPVGHPPDNIYGLPHFDIHFYIISQNERKVIRGGTDKTSIPAMYMPPDYGFLPQEEYASVPEMGVHFVDKQSPELHGQTFTRTLIYGYYKGKFIFLEPMITKAYLSTVTNEIIPFKHPEAFQRAGFYPDTYEVNYNESNQTIDIMLTDFTYYDAVTSTKNPGIIPEGFLLSQNYPNPFNPATTIKFQLPQSEFVTLKIFDALGNEVKTLVREEKPAGIYDLEWKPVDITSGVYFYQIQAGSFLQTRKMLMLK